MIHSREMQKPLILLASERSGSNLLRAILVSNSAIASPPPAGLVVAMAPHEAKYRKKDGALDRRRYIKDALTLTQLHWSPWDIRPTIEEIEARMCADNFWALFRAMNEAYAEKKGGRYWLTKEPEIAAWAQDILLNYSDAKFIVLVRDGRDVALSRLKGRLHEFHIFGAAAAWSAGQKHCREALTSQSAHGRICLVTYEELIRNPKKAILQLASFIGVEFEDQMLEYYKNREIIAYSGRTPLWGNIGKPINSSNQGKYKRALSNREIRVFEAIAWEELKYFG